MRQGNKFIYQYRICFHIQITSLGSNLVGRRIIHYIYRSNKCRHIISRFFRQIRSNFPKISRARFCNGTFYISFTAIIGRKREQPIAQLIISISKISCRSVTCLYWIFSFVYVIIYFKTVSFTCCKHKLPQSCCTNSRTRIGIHF